MSCRTVLPLFCAAFFSMSLTKPSPAQIANPWRITAATEAPMPRAKSGRFTIELGIKLGTGRAAAKPQTGSGVETTGWWVNDSRPSHSCCTLSCAGTTAPQPCTGTWYREIEGAVVSATFSGDEMKLCMTHCDEGGTICFTITADYTMTKEGLVHGVVTGADVAAKRGSNASAGALCVMPLAAMAAELQKLVDCPFSFRTKTTSAGVMVSNLKIAAEGMDKQTLAMVCGMFKPAPDGKLPSPRVTNRVLSNGHFQCPSYPAVVEYPFQAVPPTRPSVPATVVPAGGMVPPTLPQSFAPPRPMNVPAGEFEMMAGVFGQLLNAPGAPSASPALVPAPVRVPTLAPPLVRRIERPR
jgi:hypothetical protein